MKISWRAARGLRLLAFCALGAVLGPALVAQATLPPGTTDPDAQAQTQESDPMAGIESAIEAKNYVAATSQLDVWLSAHPNDARALFDRGYVADAQNQTADAESWYRKAIDADPKQFEARLALGMLLAAKGDDADSQAAKEQLQAALQLQPNPPNPAAVAQADRALARLLRSSDPTGARDALVAALRLTPETEADTLLAAEIAEAAGNNDLAEEAYRKVLNEDPNSSAATAGLAHVYMAAKRYSDAQPLVEAALGRDPDDPALNAQLAAILSAEGKHDEALARLRKLHQLEPASASVTGMLADAEFQAGNLDQADALFVQLLASQPNDASLLDAHGQVLIRQQRYADAVAAFRKATAAKPDDIDAWSGIAFADSELHQYQDELTALSMRSKFAPENPSTLFLWATAFDNLHQTKQAVDAYHRFLAADQGKFPDQEWQAKHRLVALEK
ncbi:MAG TPA: tetratricopeptide repeat protein [Acidobacteriaceae bacterium]|nr:tetratricopeptide repeat protein [Acidobacteriaceae bacterium]